jgi:acetoacetyl-CoA synthetase
MSRCLWKPNQEFIKKSNLSDFKKFIQTHTNNSFTDYESLHNWSIHNISSFWKLIFDYADFEYEGNTLEIFKSVQSPHIYRWFSGIKINYTEQIFANCNEDDIAIQAFNENHEVLNTSFKELKQEVNNLLQALKELGVKKGDTVAGYVTNTKEALIAFLATNALGAVWSSCSPDFGLDSVVDRFRQIEPKVLFYTKGYQYNGKHFDKSEVVRSLINALPSLVGSIGLDDIIKCDIPTISYHSIPENSNPITFTKVDFNEPIWVLYSSGTTGKPKAITHSVGGILVEHYKALVLHHDVKPKDKFFWYSTTGWMMWNYANSALLNGATVVLYDGALNFPSPQSLWQKVDEIEITHFGAGAGYFIHCMKEGVDLSRFKNFPKLKSIGSTGSPLTPDAFNWIYTSVSPEVWLVSLSGGTDICSGFVGGNPWNPVYEGEIQCSMLGVDLAAYSEDGTSVFDALGEMVIRQPMPSMPIKFWGDDAVQSLYKSAYYEHFKGVWRHGDWIKITQNKGVIIYGRSDSTLNRGGVRIGTSEIYSALNSLEFIQDAMVICVDYDNQEQWMPLFVVSASKLTEEQITTIKKHIRATYSPRHVPDEIIQVPEIPYTISGKKMETPIKKLFMGKDIEKSLSKDAMKNPESIEVYLEIYKSKK